MATLTADRAQSSFPRYTGLGGGSLSCAYGVYNVATNPTAADIIQMHTLPAKATVLGGFLMCRDLDTNGTETLDVDVGWEATSDEIADPDGFGNFGVLDGDAVAGLKPEVGVRMAYGGVLYLGPKTFSAEATIALTIVAAAATLTAGNIWVRTDYQTP